VEEAQEQIEPEVELGEETEPNEADLSQPATELESDKDAPEAAPGELASTEVVEADAANAPDAMEAEGEAQPGADSELQAEPADDAMGAVEDAVEPEDEGEATAEEDDTAEPELIAAAEPMADGEQVAEPEMKAAAEAMVEEAQLAEQEAMAAAEAMADGAQAAELETMAEAAQSLGAGEPAMAVEEPDDGRLWYVVHCYSGYENKVRHNLEQRIETMNMKGKIFDVVVPTEEEMEVREGKRRTVERRVFPGYILVQMLMDEDSWYVVRNTPGVTGFVGMGNEPTPLRPEEVAQIIKRMEAEAPRIKVTYKIGQKVRIIDGPFNDFIGTVDDIDMNKAKVRVMVSFFGRETPVELDFLQVEKA
jgi:transcriptional antiterminator NusG